jgi:hypothetical protein
MEEKWTPEIALGILTNAVLTNDMISYIGKKLKRIRNGKIKIAVPTSYVSLSEDLGSFNPTNEVQEELITHLKIIVSHDNVTDAELRVALPIDFGREKAITWVYWTE